MSERWVCWRSHGQSARRRAHQLVEADQLRRPPAPPAAGSRATSGGRARRPGRGRPTPPGDRLVGQPEALEHGHRLGRRVVDRQLDRRTGPRGVSQWDTSSGPRSPAASTAKRAPSTTRTPSASGSTPRRTQARSRNESPGTTSTSTRPSAAEQRHAALGHRRRPGHGVERPPVLGGRGHQLLDDGGVDVLLAVGGVVLGVERRRVRHGRGRRVAGGAQEAHRHVGDGGEGGGGQQVGAAGAEADDHHPGRHEVRPRRAARSRSGRGSPRPPARPRTGGRR